MTRSSHRRISDPLAAAAPETLSPETLSEETVLAPLALNQRVLGNGLRVVLLEDHRSPTVAVSVGYHVGGKDDPPGRSGFAHLFEHLMFKGTSATAPETIDRLTEDVGGFNNAYTAEDLTVYYEVVPSNYLETILWAEADRLGALNVDEANFRTEREVVIGEYDQRVLADPYGMLDELVNREAYRRHPYRNGVIGSPEDLRAASLDDVRRFHATYYRPDNAVLVVVGDFDGERVERWIDAYFGGIARPSESIPRVDASIEPAPDGPRRRIHRAPSAPLPALSVTHRIGSAVDVDAPVLDVIETLLGMGKSSRLHRSLIYAARAASHAHAIADLREQPGLFEIAATLNPDATVAEAERLIDEELRRLREEPVEPRELEKVKTQVTAALVRARETFNDLALALVRAAIVRGDPRVVDDDLRRFAAVRADDILRVARTCFVAERRSVIEYLPASTAAAVADDADGGRSGDASA